MPNLNDSQLVILSAASQRENGAILPLPKSLKRAKPAVAKLLAGLLKRGLVAEHPAKADALAWREGRDGQRFALALTPAGRKAVGAEEPDRPADKPAKAMKAAKAAKPRAEAPAGRPGTKLALLTNLLRRKGGATIADAVKATGWQAHSVRGAISGTLKKKLGLAVASEAVEGRGRVYRIAR